MCESSATVTEIDAVSPALVNVALPEASPESETVTALERAEAVDALPVTSPVTAPMNVPATKDSEPTVHLSLVSSHSNVFAVEPPLVILIPESSVGEPEVKLLFNAMILSARLIVSEFTVVVVPETVKSPETVSESLEVVLLLRHFFGTKQMTNGQ